MSTKRHRKYFTVTKTSIVHADNQSEARLAADGDTNVNAEVLISNVDVHQVRASQAKEIASAK